MQPTDEFATSPTLLARLSRPTPDEEAWRRFVTQYRPLIQRWCRRAGLQDADVDEVTDRISARLVELMRDGRYDPDRGRFRAWLKAVVGNAVLTFRREELRHPGDRGSGDSDVHRLLDAAKPEELAEDLDAAVEQLRVLEELADRVRGRLEPKTWVAFRMTVMDGDTIAEAAAKLGMSATAVTQAKYRVVQMLRAEAMRPREGDEAPTD